MKWSAQQKDIFAAAKKGSNVLVSADAGTGKSTTMFGIAEKLDKPSLMLSFNKDMAVENIKRAKAMKIFAEQKGGYLDIRTFHSWGLTFFPNKKRKINLFKVDNACDKHFSSADARYAAYILKDMRGQGFLGSSPREIHDALEEGQTVSTDKKAQWLKRCSALSAVMKELDNNFKEVDFDDMCRLPIVNNWIVASALPDVLYVDEVQDLNPAQRTMLELAIKAKPMQVIAVGDKKQAIYGFRGGFGSLEAVKDIIGGVELPLNTTYRMGSNIVEFVNDNVDDSEMLFVKDGGTVKKVRLDEDDDYDFGTDHIVEAKVDMVIASRNSTLIAIWLDLLELKIDASLKGSNIIAGLKHVAGSVSSYNWSQFLNELKLIGRAGIRSRKLTAHSDGALALLDIIDHLKIRSKHELYKQLDEMNLVKSGIKLETVHSAKGREADRVAVVCDWWMTEEQQRDNVRYVAFTRSKDFMLLIKPLD